MGSTLDTNISKQELQKIEIIDIPEDILQEIHELKINQDIPKENKIRTEKEH